MLSKERILSLVVGTIAILFVFVIWFLAVTYTKVSLFFPSPQEVFVKFFESMVQKIGKYTLLEHTFFSLKRVFVGFGLSSIVGIVLGVGMGYSKTINAIARPIFNIVRPIPGLAWIPLAIGIVGFLLANIMRILERRLCSWTIRGN